MIKMLLVSEGVLNPNETTQDHIARVNKKPFITTNQELFNHLLDHGFLLLNATLVLRSKMVRKDAIAWEPFTKYLLHFLAKERNDLNIILFGQVAYRIDQLIDQLHLKKLYAEHPYNLSFISNRKVVDFFTPFHLLRK
jgi:uracil-DNA glycosylase